jgi:hypothetical protein
MVELPERFLRWNYAGRRSHIKETLENEKSFAEAMLGFLSHTPILCTAFKRGDETVFVNGKVVGTGYVVKKEYIEEMIAVFKRYLKSPSEIGTRGSKEFKDYQRGALELLLKHLYLDTDEAKGKLDFTKIQSLELVGYNKTDPNRPAHGWESIQKNKDVCLIYYSPPYLSFEVRCTVDIHYDGLYHEYANVTHDLYHGGNTEKWKNRPAYIFNITSVHDNSATPQGFGVKIV